MIANPFNEMIKVATVCSGIGSPEVAMSELNVPHEIVFACDIDKYARASYLANFTPGEMYNDMTAEDWIGDKHYSDLFIGGIPCQAFSLAGKRLGELDKRGLLFYDYYRYVQNQQPKVFIIENVKGLLSDAGGKTFQNWLLLLGDSVNSSRQMFNHPDSLGYNLHWTVLNSKDFGVPQNRERVFIIGIRNDLPNDFRFPVGEKLTQRLKDILEPVVDEKYYLSDNFINAVTKHSDRHQEKGNGFKFEPTNGNIVAKALTTKPGQRTTDNYILVSKERRTAEAKAQRRETGTNDFRGKEITFEPSDVMNCLQTGLTNDHLIVVGQPTLNQVGDLYENGADAGRIYDSEGLARTIKSEGGGGGAKTGLYLVDDTPMLNEHRGHIDKEPRFITDGIVPTLRAESHGHETKVVVKEATKKGYAEAKEGDSINLSNPNSTTPRGRVGEQIANTLDTSCNQAVVVDEPTILQTNMSGQVFENNHAGTLRAGGSANYQVVKSNYRIRRLTPLECWRLQGFPDECFKNAQNVPTSDSQLYKQAGNSMTTKVMKSIIKNLLPILTT